MYLYLDRGTVVHRLHPVVRVLGMAALFVSAFVVDSPLGQVPLLALLLGLLIATGSLANVVRLRWLFLLIFVSTLIIWTLFYGPDGAPPLARVGPFEISRTGPRFGLGMALKLNLFLGAGILFLSVTRIEEFAYALHRLGLPYKVGFTMTMAFRLVPVFVDAAATVVQAQRCRGLAFERGSLWQRLRRYVPVIVPVFMGGLRRADQMAMALDARGFQSGRTRTTLDPYPVRGTDVAAALFLAGLTATYLALWRAGYLALL
ncbi:MAG: energy-coupling factor transporter transmembrane component T family protein [Candidatus Binatia bacterium]